MYDLNKEVELPKEVPVELENTDPNNPNLE